jgi:Flp pilus assembly protein TadG
VFTRSRGHRDASRSRGRGQSLVEFALVAPIVIAVMAAIIQFGIVFWTQNTLTQVVRDTGRWAATQPNCSVDTAVKTQAQTIAASSSLIGYSAVNFVPTVTWTGATPCPVNNKTVTYVHVTATTRVPTFFPGMEYLPGLGTCDPECHITLSSTAQFRMEPNVP